MGHAIVLLDGLIESGEFEDVNDRCKYLLVHDLSVRADLNNRRHHIVAWTVDSLATVEDLSTLTLDLFNSLSVVTQAVGAMHGAHESLRVHGVANHNIGVRLYHALDESVI